MTDEARITAGESRALSALAQALTAGDVDTVVRLLTSEHFDPLERLGAAHAVAVRAVAGHAAMEALGRL